MAGDNSSSIQAQTAAKVAGHLTDVFMRAALKDNVTTEQVADTFDFFHERVLMAIEAHAGAPAPAPAPGGGAPAPAPRGNTNGGDLPYGKTVIKFGKFKGLTIAEIDAAVADDGKTGRSWLEWAGDKLDDDFLKKAITGYLKAAA